MDSNMQGPQGLTAQRLLGMRRGLEKESLRATAEGQLALTPHPAILGSALTHPHITTDFSESQVELITGVHGPVQDCIDELLRVQAFTVQSMGPEMLWVSSMPCALPQDDGIPLGQYGSSNVGQAKTVYRAGLGHRYGRRMQTISGIHYNWSLPEVSSAAYFGLIRNFRRHAFLLLYLFGASPAVSSCFVEGRAHSLQPLSKDTHYLPYATSLRMGRLGYQSDAQASLAVSYNSLDGYAQSLHQALTQPFPAYEAIGLCDAQGHYQQLATSLLQIENEFYGTIRPKRVIFPGERPLHALRERGVEYVEVRLMDLDPFELVGIQPRTLRFLDIFLLHCLQSESPPDTPAEIAAIARNQHLVAERGREPGLLLERGERKRSLQDWGQALLGEMQGAASALDAAHQCSDYSEALQAAEQGLAQPDTLPSARVLMAIGQHGGSFTSFVQARSLQTRQAMLEWPLDPAERHALELQSQQSLADQRETEASDSLPFDIYLQRYLSPERLVPASSKLANQGY
jgi:glutamate--cysteine ligase